MGIWEGIGEMLMRQFWSRGAHSGVSVQWASSRGCVDFYVHMLKLLLRPTILRSWLHGGLMLRWLGTFTPNHVSSSLSALCTTAALEQLAAL